MKKTILYLLVCIIFIACKKVKLDENEDKYKVKELHSMIEGKWEVVEYLVDGISYLDTFFKVNPTGNCKTYTIKQWKNSYISKTDKDCETGYFGGDCITIKPSGYSFNPKNKSINFCTNSSIFLDPIYSTNLYSESFLVLKLENNEMILTDYKTFSHYRRIYFKKL